ncbi:MAG TPA: IS3 family transposase [Candidatus Angelobacter sp.]|jgi:transposase InsO family protein
MLSVERMCDAAEVSRAGYYRQLNQSAPEEAEMALRASIQEIVLKHHRRYGYRRVTAELQQRGMVVNHKRVLRLMRSDNLLAVRYRKFVLTTHSRREQSSDGRPPDYEVVLNLAARLNVTGINQLWVADITFIRLQMEFVFLAVVIDRFSRKVIGWALDRTLAARLAVTALEQAIARRPPPPGVVHHSDQGVQYACEEYRAVLQTHQLIPSLSRPANPYDNAVCESFMKTLKQEEIYCHQYRDLDELSAHLEEFLENYYNRQRLHSALGYRTPEEFEQAAASATNTGAAINGATMNFFNPPKDPKKKRATAATSVPPNDQNTAEGEGQS